MPRRVSSSIGEGDRSSQKTTISTQTTPSSSQPAGSLQGGTIGEACTAFQERNDYAGLRIMDNQKMTYDNRNPALLPTMTEVEAAYVAGFIDGEGSIFPIKEKRPENR